MDYTFDTIDLDAAEIATYTVDGVVLALVEREAPDGASGANLVMFDEAGYSRRMEDIPGGLAAEMVHVWLDYYARTVYYPSRAAVVTAGELIDLLKPVGTF